MTTEPVVSRALDAVDRVRADLGDVRLIVPLAESTAAAADAQAAARQIDDYVRPRLADLDAPLLVVVGGSTGSGKSTLVNSLVGRPVSPSGVIRPTTRTPTLIHHPGDAASFSGERVLPSLHRLTGSGVGAPESAEGTGATSMLRLVAADQVPPAIALLDAPDIDSISDENRALARALLAAADLWVFVTTAHRYADAVPWQLLDQAAARTVTVAVVLNRVPAGAEPELRTDLDRMLAERGLGDAPVFAVAEQATSADGLLPAGAVAPLDDWLRRLAADRTERARIASSTLTGVVRELRERCEPIAAAIERQATWAGDARAAVARAHVAAAERVIAATSDGALLRGEVLARWHDVVGTSDVFRAVEGWFSRTRDSVTRWFSGKPAPIVEVETSIEHGLHAVLVDAGQAAAAESWQRLQSDPAGRFAVADRPDLAAAAPGLAAGSAELIRHWQASLVQLVTDNAGSKRTKARLMSLGLNAVTVSLMVVVFAATGGLTGGELVIAGGSAVVGQKLLETIFGEDAVRRLAQRARTDLDERVSAFLLEQRGRYDEAIDAVAATGIDAVTLRGDAAAMVTEVARVAQVAP